MTDAKPSSTSSMPITTGNCQEQSSQCKIKDEKSECSLLLESVPGEGVHVVPSAGYVLCSSSEEAPSGCHWSTEEDIIQKQRAYEATKIDAAFLYSGMHDTPVLHTPYFYGGCEYDYGLEHGGIEHSPSGGHGFGRHQRSKIGADPTVLLTILRWAKISSSRLIGDDDHIDRLNYQITSLILLLLIALTGFRQYLSHLPLQCWIPQEFSRSWEEYAEHYCWVTNTYFSRIEERLPPPDERTHVVRYYQWAPFVLGLQAAGFYLPCLIWRLLQNYSGFQVQRIMRCAMGVGCTPRGSAPHILSGLASYIDQIIYHRRYKFWQRHSSFFNKHGENVKKNSLSSYQFTNVHKLDYSALSVFCDLNWGPQNQGTASTHATAEMLNISGTAQRRHKKQPAPPPPDPAKCLSSVGCRATKASSTPPPVEKKDGPTVRKIRPKTVAPENDCGVCLRCMCKPKTHEKKNQSERGEGSRSSKTSTQGEEESGDNTSPLLMSSTSAKSKSINRRFGYCIVCCRSQTYVFQPPQGLTGSRSVARPSGPPKPSPETLMPTKSKRSKSGFRFLHIIRFLCTALWFLFRIILTFFCIIPGCLCHCLRGSQNSKCIQRSNCFLFYLYATTKLFYLANLIAQIYLIKLFLGAESHLFGVYVLRDLIQGNMWTQTGNFPRVTYCDFEAKKTGKNYKYTLQCVLPLNLFLEKVYVFLWFWMITVAFFTAHSLFKWLSRISIPKTRHHFVCKYLIPWKFPELFKEDNKRLINMFTEEYLDLNGVFLLWLISLNAGELVTGDLVSSLWDLFEARVSSKSGPPIMIMSCGNQLDANVLKEHKFYDDDSMSPSVHSLPDSTSKHTFQSESAKQGAQRFTPQAFLPNRIPPYCTIPKRRTTKCRAPEVPCSIPLLTTLPRKKHWGSFKTNPDVILASASVNPESAINFQAASCSFDSSLDSIV